MDISGKVDVPALGPVNKKVVIGIGGAAAVYIGYMYYRSRGATDSADVPVDPGMEDPGTIPSVSGAIKDDNSYGSGGGTTPPASDDYGFSGTTNSQWTQYTSTQLAQSDRWSYTDIVDALGNYLAGKPLSTTQQAIAQAAIAIAGYPPVGSHVIVPGGNTAILVAPTGLKVSATTANSVTLTFNPVAGAGLYRAYRSGASSNVGAADNPQIMVSGLQPNTSYSFQVAADTTSGAPGPKSSPVTGKTKAVTLAKPTGLKATAVTKSTVTVTCSKVTGAQYYRWYVDNHARGASDGPTYTIGGLSAKKKYTITVAADTTSNSPGPRSAGLSVTTKSK